MKKHAPKTPKVPEAAEPKGKRAESRAVLAIRIPMQDRDRLRQAAGWGKQQDFVYAAIMSAIERAEKK
jgi:hypothetical protein